MPVRVPRFLDRGYGAGADDFVSKPIHAKVASTCIRVHTKMLRLSLQLADHTHSADEMDLVPSNVGEALESALNMLDHKVRNRVTVHRQYGATGEVHGPARASNRVTLNLVDD